MASVQLALSALGGVPGAMAYHSSVLVDGQEFSFSHLGIRSARGPVSHTAIGGLPAILDFGSSLRPGQHVGKQLVAVLAPHFLPKSYDLLRKNCNTFTDAALVFLVRQRLNTKYKALEQVGSTMPALVRVASGGRYAPNPNADSFDLEALIRILDVDRSAQAEHFSVDRCAACPNPLAFLSWLPGGIGTCLSGRPEGITQEDAKLARQFQQQEEDILADGQGARSVQAEEDANSKQKATPCRSLHRRLPGPRASPCPGPRVLCGARAGPRDDCVDGSAAGEFRADRVEDPSAGGASGGVGREAAPGRQPRPQRPGDDLQDALRALRGTSGGVGREAAARRQPRPQRRGDLLQDALRRTRVRRTRRQEVCIPQGTAGRHRTSGRGVDSSTLDALTVVTAFSGPGSAHGIRGRLKAIFRGKKACHAGSAAGVSGTDDEHEAQECVVCLEAFTKGDKLRILPCLHGFHKRCVDSWLCQSSECPLCKHSVLP
uniref:RING-type domain-containing protein n=1 Tax=Alexandrium monilatum TaxID=311494 RepID=A0A7S4VNP9_9DINO